MLVRQTYHDFVRRDVYDLIEDQAGAVLDFGGGIGATSADLRASGRASRAVLFDQVADNGIPEIDAVEAVDLDDSAAVSAALERHGPFDTILALDILEHLKEPWRAVEMLEGALRPGGILIVSVPNINYIGVTWPLITRGRFDYVAAGVLDRTHLRWFTRPSAIELAKGSALQIEAITVNLPGRKGKYLNALSLGLFERFLAIQYKIRVRKVA